MWVVIVTLGACLLRRCSVYSDSSCRRSPSQPQQASGLLCANGEHGSARDPSPRHPASADQTRRHHSGTVHAPLTTFHRRFFYLHAVLRKPARVYRNISDLEWFDRYVGVLNRCSQEAPPPSCHLIKVMYSHPGLIFFPFDRCRDTVLTGSVKSNTLIFNNHYYLKQSKESASCVYHGCLVCFLF